MVSVTVGEPLPTGVHLLADGTPVVVGPPALLPPDRRTWGWQVQLYQLRSARSWGIGDYADLRTLARELGARGADVLLVNPMHAVTPVPPIQPSPYFPSSRRFADQVGVAVEALPEYAAAPDSVRARVDALRPPSGPLIDRDAVWTAKRAAFALLLPPDRSGPQPEVDWTGVDGFAVFSALAEQHGAHWPAWPGAAAAAGSGGGGRGRPGAGPAAPVDPAARGRAVGRRAAGSQGRRDGDRGRARPGRRRRPGRGRRLAAAGRPGHRRHGRGAAGPVRAARAGLGVPAVPARAAGRDRVPAVPAGRAGGAGAWRRAAGRPRDGAVPALVGAGRARRGQRDVRLYDHGAMLRVLVLEAPGPGRWSSARTSARSSRRYAGRWTRPGCSGRRCSGSPGTRTRPRRCRRAVAGAGGGERVHTRPADRVRLPGRRTGPGPGRAGSARPAGRRRSGPGYGPKGNACWR